MKRFMLAFFIFVTLSSAAFSKVVTVKYANFPSTWNVTYKVDKNEPLPLNPPMGLWMTREGKLSKTIEFTDSVEFKTENPSTNTRTNIRVTQDNSILELAEKNGEPSWELKF